MSETRSNNDFDEVELLPSSSGTAQETRRQSDRETLQHRYQRLQHEKEDLELRERIRALETEVDMMRNRLTGKETDSSMHQDNESAVVTTSLEKRRRDDSESSESRAKRRFTASAIKPIKPERYTGKSYRSYKEYIRQCEKAYRMLPDVYEQDSAKVLYASQYIGGELADAFERFEETKGRDNITWEEFKEFLKDEQMNPVTHTTTLARRYDEAIQRPGQSVAQFVNYLDDLEAELEPYSDEHRRQHLLAKLSPEIRHALNNYQEIPSTRNGLIRLAIQLEANLPRQRPSKESKADNSRPADSTTPSRKRNRDGTFVDKAKEETSVANKNEGAPSKSPTTRRQPDITPEE